MGAFWLCQWRAIATFPRHTRKEFNYLLGFIQTGFGLCKQSQLPGRRLLSPVVLCGVLVVGVRAGVVPVPDAGALSLVVPGVVEGALSLVVPAPGAGALSSVVPAPGAVPGVWV